MRLHKVLTAGKTGCAGRAKLARRNGRSSFYVRTSPPQAAILAGGAVVGGEREATIAPQAEGTEVALKQQHFLWSKSTPDLTHHTTLYGWEAGVPEVADTSLY